MPRMRKLFFLAVLLFSIPASAQERPKIFVKPIPGGTGKANTTAGVESEIAKRCQNVTVTEDKEKANYVLDFSANSNEFALFNRDGDLVQRGSATIYHKAIEKVCKAIK
jgi:hypothetical protein